MFKHNLLVAFRNIKRNKSTFSINLIGLSTGLACALLIYLWVNDELKVDKFHKNDNQLIQVWENFHLADRIVTQSEVPDLLAETMIDEYPEIKYAASVTPSEWFGFTLSYNETHLKATGQFADVDFFKIFSFDLLQGNSGEVLKDKHSIVLTESLAKKFFNTTENIIGKTVHWRLLSLNYESVVSGIVKDAPSISSMKFDFVLTFEMWKEVSVTLGRTLHWDNHGPHAFFILQPGTDLEKFNKKIADFHKKKLEGSKIEVFTRKYSDGYLYSNFENGVPAGGRIEYVELFSIIAIFILLIACINFMNLSTAKASGRLKEVGIKKAVGAGRKSLITQYLSESIIISFISLATALLMVELLLPQFNDITGKNLYLVFSLEIIFPLLGITLLTGIISGSYPAVYISGFNPITVLKGKINTLGGELWIRKVLVVFQFALSIILIAAVLIVYKQTEFIQTKNLGYTKDNIIYFDKEGKASDNQDVFLQELKKVPGVVNASSIHGNLIGTFSSTAGVGWEGKNPEDIIRFEMGIINYDLLETYDIKIKEGRSFLREFSTDKDKIILNEAAIDVMGMKDPIGKNFKLWGNDKEIIGVIKNFHFESLHETVKPLFFVIDPEKTLYIMVKIEAGREKETMENISKFYSEFNPGFPFDFKFLDKDYQKLYEAETRVSTLSKYFAGLAILISCLGLLGLATFTAQKRKKEIGIRKVLGSSEFGIIYLLSVDFTKLIIASLVIALPVSYYLTKNWLDTFAYRIDLSLWYFVIAGLITLIVAWLTVGIQAIRAATANPVKSLRYE